MSVDLGRLERIEVRSTWLSEASDFTPWLGQQENLAILADTLGLEFDLEARERPVGPFRADLLCKEVGTNRWVLIENQLERTDHTHLGQLLTYASGLEAAIVIWIAARFTEEHRSTLDWLNRITGKAFQFFGLEIELWRIGQSPAAPKFNVVSKPNDWSASVASSARALEYDTLSETQTMQRAYWDAFHAVLRDVGGPVGGNRKAQPQSWMAYPVGRTGFNLGTGMVRPKKQIRAELYISGDNAKAFLAQLKDQQTMVEQELGYSLEWEDLPSRRDCRVAAYLAPADPEDERDWPRQHEWLAKHLNDLHRVLAPRVAALDTARLEPAAFTTQV